MFDHVDIGEMTQNTDLLKRFKVPWSISFNFLADKKKHLSIDKLWQSFCDLPSTRLIAIETSITDTSPEA